MGGAMDLISHPKTKVIVLMEHVHVSGSLKILEQCDLPLTGKQCVDKIITDLGVFEIRHGHGLTITEIAQGASLDEIRDKTGCHVNVDENLKVMEQVKL